PNNKRKTLASIKGKEKAHPYSRKATQMRRAINRQVRIEQGKLKRNELMTPKGLMFLWFKENMDTGRKAYSKEEAVDLAREYLARNDEAISEIKEKLRPGRPMDPKDKLLIEMMEKERSEAARGAMGKHCLFTCTQSICFYDISTDPRTQQPNWFDSVEIPNITNPKIFKILKEWDGDMNSIHLIKDMRIAVDPAKDSEPKSNTAGADNAGSSSIERAIAAETGMIVS
ncbi:translation machinery-associated protein 16, partial [Mycoemilia scoparia]